MSTDQKDDKDIEHMKEMLAMVLKSRAPAKRAKAKYWRKKIAAAAKRRKE